MEITEQDRFVDACRRLAGKGLTLWNPGVVHKQAKVIEECAGKCDVGGWLSQGHSVSAYETNVEDALAGAREWPWIRIRAEVARPQDCDMVILANGGAPRLAPEWLPHAKYAIVAGDGTDGSLESEIIMAGHNVIDERKIGVRTVYLSRRNESPAVDSSAPQVSKCELVT